MEVFTPPRACMLARTAPPQIGFAVARLFLGGGGGGVSCGAEQFDGVVASQSAQTGDK